MDDFLRNVREQQDYFRRLSEGPLRYVRENQAAIEAVQELLRGTNLDVMRDAIGSLDFKSRLPEYLSTAALTKQTLSSFALPESVAEMQRFADQYREVNEAITQARLPYRELAEQVQTMSRYFESTYATLAAIDHTRIGELISTNKWQQDLVGRTTLALEHRNADLIASLNLAEGRLASAPAFVSELPTLDLFVHSRAIRSVTPHRPNDSTAQHQAASLRVAIVEETTAFLELKLPELKPAFLAQYRGAKARAKDRGPDWWTQGGASMRKLLKGVLHNAAPNELVLPWAQKNGKGLDPHGRPTRATKVDWLCEFYPHPAYRATVKMELIAALAVIGLLDTSQHEDDSPEFEEQYDEIILRAEVAICHILTIWRARNSH